MTTIMVGDVEVEEVPARTLAVQDHVIFGDGSTEFPIHAIDTVEPGLLRLQVGLLRPGFYKADHGTIPVQPWQIVRRVCR